MQIDFNAAKPIYEQVIDGFKKEIARGDLQPGDKLPSQRDMAKEIEVNPNTVQRAYREMENIELVETKRGRGTFIKEGDEVMKKINKEMACAALEKFISEMFSLGFTNDEVKELLIEELEGRNNNE